MGALVLFGGDCMRYTFLNQAKKILIKRIGTNNINKIMVDSKKRLNELLELNKDEPKGHRRLTHKNIYPAIALLSGLMLNGYERDSAIILVKDAINTIAEGNAKSMQGLFKIPGLYKLYPRIFSRVQKKSFGEKSGFKSEVYPTAATRCKFDMKKCLYYDTLSRYNATDLCGAFCHNDDIMNERLHKKLAWARTKTIGLGGDVCDFDIYIKDKKE